MTFRYFGTDITAAGDAITAVTDDTIFIDEGVSIISTGAAAIDGADAISNIAIEVHGTVAGALLGINMAFWTGSNTVTVGATGRIIGDVLSAVDLDGSDAVLNNAGSIASYGDGGAATVFFASDRAYLNNSGTIFASQGNSMAIDFSGTLAVSTNTLINTGSIISTNEQDIGADNLAFRGDDGAVDVVINRGLIIGNLVLQGGDDSYDGQGGRVIGIVDGGTGDDTLTGGDFNDSLFGGDNLDIIRGNGGIDELDGGAGNNDTVYFSIEDASVMGGSGTGDVAVNTYDAFGLTFDVGGNGFEVYVGSAAGETIVTTTSTSLVVGGGGGNDRIVGSSSTDSLNGQDGNDTIIGGGGIDFIDGGNGNDRLDGGAGIDTLQGGAGDDTFVIEGVGGGNDEITDFVIGHDRIEILRSGFLDPTQWNPGDLDPARFVASAAPAPVMGVAAFLFDNAGPGAGQLFWNDGSGGATGIAMITVDNPLFFSSQDFVLV